MTTPFRAIARYYDLLYREKDTAAEVRYADALLRRHRPGVRTVLDLGCGTGRHVHGLAALGYRATGVDRSEGMIAEARERLARLSPAGGGSAEFHVSDIRSLRLGRTFDAVVSLFHVMSYQTTDADLLAAFETAAAHLGPGGVFLFDCWWGPGVLSDPPTARAKEAEDEHVALARFAEPLVLTDENVVEVSYRLVVSDKRTGGVEEIRETHRMRYLFGPEIEGFARRAGLDTIERLEFMTDREPGPQTWSACFLLKR